jgi:biofilm PGA synthesis N-glycosyltransferase PgaC
MQEKRSVFYGNISKASSLSEIITFRSVWGRIMGSELMLFLATLATLLAFLAVPTLAYYLWMKKKENSVWGLTRNEEYRPKVSLVVATYNEAAVIRRKLENIKTLDYPEDKLQVLIVDSNSTDGTLDVCRAFLADVQFRFPIQLISEKERLGKSHALNTALDNAEGMIIATSDADSFWEKDALLKAVSFFADPSVGAVTGREKLLNLEKSVHTMSEGIYRGFYYTLRLGESKIHSTLIFQGELSLYRRSAFNRFEDRPGYSDDTGTVISMVSKGYRCIFVPDATFHDTAAYSLSGRLMLKSRRAQHLIAGIIQSIRFKLNGKLKLPWSVVFFNFYLHVLSPLIAFSALFVAVAVLAFYFQIFWFIPLLFLVALLFKKPRLFAVSYLTSNIALIIGLVQHFARRRSMSWRKIEEMRTE